MPIYALKPCTLQIRQRNSVDASIVVSILPLPDDFDCPATLTNFHKLARAEGPG